MKRIKIQFSDFWNRARNPENNFFYTYLNNHYRLELSDNPDFLIYSCFGSEFLNYDCTKIYYTPENIRPRYHECDFALTFDYSSSPYHKRLPLYVLSALDFNNDLSYLIRKNRDLNHIFKDKSEFCSFVYGNDRPKKRIKFANKLANYKSLDCGGKVLKNTNKLDILDKKYSNHQHPWRKSKIEFIRQSKFNIAFENESYPGYQSEKLIDAFIADSIPIYWGNPEVTKEFNPKAFINAHNYPNHDELVKRVIEIDTNEDLYLEILSQPIFINNEIPEGLDLGSLHTWFENVFENKIIAPHHHRKKSSKIRSYGYHTAGKHVEKVYNKIIGKTKNYS